MTIFYGYILGIPTDWIIFGVFLPILGMVIAAVAYLFFFKGEAGPIDEDMAMIIPIDMHGTIQVGTLLGGCQRTETDLIITHPEWKDDDGNQYTDMIPIEKVTPLPYMDVGSKAVKRLWPIRDEGTLSAMSMTTMIKGSPKRWDLPYADRRKAGKFLVGRYGNSSLTSLLSSKTGALVILGVFLSGGMFAFMVTVLTGHLG